GQFALFSIIAAVIAIAIGYPFVMTNAHRAATWVMRSVSHEAIITGFAALICVICVYEGGLLALGVTITVGLDGGLFSRMSGMQAGVQFMGYYVAVLTGPALPAPGPARRWPPRPALLAGRSARLPTAGRRGSRQQPGFVVTLS